MRVHGPGVDDELLWQRVVSVRDGLKDLASFEPSALVSPALSEWIEPGHYPVVPLSHANPKGWGDSGNGMNGPVVGESVQVEIRSDGSVLPNPVRFSPLVARAAGRDAK